MSPEIGCPRFAWWVCNASRNSGSLSFFLLGPCYHMTFIALFNLSVTSSITSLSQARRRGLAKGKTHLLKKPFVDAPSNNFSLISLVTTVSHIALRDAEKDSFLAEHRASLENRFVN